MFSIELKACREPNCEATVGVIRISQSPWGKTNGEYRISVHPLNANGVVRDGEGEVGYADRDVMLTLAHVILKMVDMKSIARQVPWYQHVKERGSE